MFSKIIMQKTNKYFITICLKKHDKTQGHLNELNYETLKMDLINTLKNSNISNLQISLGVFDLQFIQSNYEPPVWRSRFHCFGLSTLSRRNLSKILASIFDLKNSPNESIQVSYLDTNSINFEKLLQLPHEICLFETNGICIQNKGVITGTVLNEAMEFSKTFKLIDKIMEDCDIVSQISGQASFFIQG